MPLPSEETTPPVTKMKRVPPGFHHLRFRVHHSAERV